ncbi:MAG: lamin tail domain-containing protein [Bacteroidales bacterium]|nr:lamin tail domain-containing protein [Bacteroidales bacterium]
MKKLLYIFMIAAILVSCKKNSTETPAPVNQQTQEVTFDINTILESPDREYAVPNCIDSIDGEINKYAQIVIMNSLQEVDTFYAEVYYVEGLPYTKAIMLPVLDDDDDCDTYTLLEFYVWDNNGTPGYDESARLDDQLFKAAPLAGSEFWDFAVDHVDVTFEVCAFYKTKIKIDVLCFVPNDFELFGFFWFEITEITVREMCFFGDFCIEDPSIYASTEYASGGGVFIDEAAIFEIRARHQIGDGQLADMVGTDFNNMDWDGIGEPLCIRYPDYDAEVDYYEFDLYLWAMVGSTMDWVLIDTYVWNDIFENTYDPGTDGVWDFVVGDCVASESNIVYPPYVNIPDPSLSAGDLIITEIMQNPQAVSDSDGEWFEVYNTTDHPIDMLGMAIRDDGSDSHVIAENLIVPSGGFVILGNNIDDMTNGGVQVDYSYGSSWFLANGDDEVVIETEDLLEIDRVNYDGGPNFPDPNGASMSLDPDFFDATANDDGANWCEATSSYGDGDKGTPGIMNDECSEPPAPINTGDLVITEIMANPAAVADGDGEWFEVYNSTDHPIEMEGLTIRDDDFDSHVIGASLVVPSYGYVVLGINDNTSENGGLTVDYAYTGFTLGNSGDEVVIETTALLLIDHVGYSSSSSGKSRSLDPNFLNASENDNVFNWCTEISSTYGDGDYGTPGQANNYCLSK